MKFIVLSIMIVSFSLSAKIYKYKDRYGSVHYVDDISKIPSNKLNQVKTMKSKFFPSENAVVDKYRRILLKKGVYYKELSNQKDALILWGSLMINYGFQEFKVDMSRISSIKFVTKKGKKLSRRQKRKLASNLALHFKSFESAWPKVYEEIHFKSSGSNAIDLMRKNRKILRTSSGNISVRIKLLEEWSAMMKDNPSKYDTKLIIERMNKISALYDVPKPNLPVLFKYIDKTVLLFEKEFRK